MELPWKQQLTGTGRPPRSKAWLQAGGTPPPSPSTPPPGPAAPPATRSAAGGGALHSQAREKTPP